MAKILPGVAAISLVANVIFLSAIIFRNSSELPKEIWPTVWARLVPFFPVCHNGSELNDVKGELSAFARSWFLKHGLPTVIGKDGKIWVPKRFLWKSGDPDLSTNLSNQATRAAYRAAHGRDPDLSKVINRCPFARKWLLKNPPEESPKK